MERESEREREMERDRDTPNGYSPWCRQTAGGVTVEELGELSRDNEDICRSPPRLLTPPRAGPHSRRFHVPDRRSGAGALAAAADLREGGRASVRDDRRAHALSDSLTL
eukprot:GHVU01186900.1.p1 GENE.GHVU01186900.1~~GHVU01186900.1.p1  ORF type:complete len:109 (-),score=11.50 GHVU01186900.1:30-356(-)